MSFRRSKEIIRCDDAPERIAFTACIRHGNHDNDPLIDRALRKALYDLAVVHSAAYVKISAAASTINAALRADRASPFDRSQPTLTDTAQRATMRKPKPEAIT